MDCASNLTYRVITVVVALFLLTPIGLTFAREDTSFWNYPPTAVIDTPTMENQIFNGTIAIFWSASDIEDGVMLDITLNYSSDGGSSWINLLSGTNNNNPPFFWDTVSECVPDGVSYIFSVTATDSGNASDTDLSYMFSLDNIPDDRWYFQIESTILGSYLDLDMKPSESTIQNVSVNISAPGEFIIQSFASEYSPQCEVDLDGDWNFSLYAKVSSSDADGRLYANVYANDSVSQRLLFTTDYDDEMVASYHVFHRFEWSYLVPNGTRLQAGEHVVIEIMLHATAGSASSTNYYYANSDMPELGNVTGNYTMTITSDNQREMIEEVFGSNNTMIPILEEDFSQGLPKSWTVIDNGGPPSGPGGNKRARTWNTENYGNRSSGYPIIEPFVITDSECYHNWMDEQLITPTMDLSSASSVTLDFDQHLKLWEEGGANEWADVDVRSTLTGGSWQNVLHQNHNTPNPNHKTLNITAWAAGAPDVEIRFHYLSLHIGKWWLVDNIHVDVQVSDNVALLMHKWAIDIPTTGDTFIFSVEAKRGNNPEDDFTFAYSTDDISYYNLVTVDQQTEKIYSHTLPRNPFGTIYIRVVDTNHYSDGAISSIEIDHMFIISPTGPPQLTLGFDNYATPSFVEPGLILSSIKHLCIQDAPGGLGTNVTTHTMTTDETFTVWAVGFDEFWNYISDIPANWTNTLNAQTATNSTSFTFDPTALGSGIITAFYNATINDTTGLITVTAGLLDSIIIRDAPGGLGNEINAYTMTTDDSLTVWAAGYDADGNYVGDVSCEWSTNGTLDSQSAVMVNNVTFEPSTAGTSGYIIAVNSTIAGWAGLITVGIGILDYIIIRYSPGGAGPEVGDVLMVLGQTLTVYSAGYDADNNYIGDVPCNWTTTGTLNLTTATSSTSSTFEPAAAGETGTINATFNATIFDETGLINVSDYGLDYILIEDGLGNEITTHLMDTTETFTVWAVGYNLSVGAIGLFNANWTTTGTLDFQTAMLSQSFTFDPVHAPTNGTIEAVYETLWDSTGIITVNPGPLASICIQDAPGGTGTNVTNHTMTTEDTLTVWTIGYDADWNYIGDVDCDWTTTGTLDLQTASGVNSFTFSPIAPGVGTIEADDLAGHADSTGMITVNLGSLSHILIRDSTGGMGNEVDAHSMTTDDTFMVWAAGYDVAWNYIGDVFCNWSTNGTLDSQTAIMTDSFIFDPVTASTSGYIIAEYGAFQDVTGLITVGIGALNHFTIRDMPGGGGSEVGDVLMGVGQTLTVYSAGYDTDDNYIGDIPCNWTTTGTLNFTTATGSSSFTFEPAAAGETGRINATFNVTIFDETGIITVIADLPPVADAGPDKIVLVNGFVSFDGTGSYDDIGLTNYWWNFTDGGPVTLTGVITPPYVFDTVGIYVVTLTVRDTGGQEDQDTMIVNVTTDPTPPVADAGPDQIVRKDQVVTFNGSASYDPGHIGEPIHDGIVNWTWTFNDGGIVTLWGMNPQYTFTTVDFYMVDLVVRDAVGLTDSDQMNVSVIEVFDIDITPAASSDDWILISFPNQIEGDPLILIVDAVDEGAGLVTWDIVQWYDPQSTPGTEWKTTATFKPPSLNTFNYVNNTYGFWIHISNYGDGNLTVTGPLANTSDITYLNLRAGWNLVGYSFPTAQPSVDTFGISAGIDDMYCYEPTDPYRIRFYDWMGAEIHEPGKGYWVHVTADEILIIQCP